MKHLRVIKHSTSRSLISFFSYLVILVVSAKAQAIYVAAGSEAVFFSTIDLSTPGEQTWSTERNATPGYMSISGTASFSGAADAGSNLIDGYVKHYATAANQGAVFPVGQNVDLRTLTTSGTIPTGMEVATAWIAGDPSGNLDPTSTGAAGGAHRVLSRAGIILAVSTIGQWDWQDLSGTASSITITVSIPDVSTFAGSGSVLRLVGWDGTNWVNLSGSTGATGTSEGTSLSGTMITGISALGIGSISFPLPLDLLSFTARETNCNANLRWETANEVNTSHFDIEISEDGRNFRSIGRVEAQGSGTGHTYSYVAKQDVGNALYRLKLVDLDARFSYSPVISLRTSCGLSSVFLLYPNPLTHSEVVTIKLSTTAPGAATIELFGMDGRQLKRQPATIVLGVNTYFVDVNGLVPGTYLIRVLDHLGQVLVPPQKLIKQ